MENVNVSIVRRAGKYWFLPLILGIILVSIGIWVFRTPLASYLTLSILFAVTFLVTGIIEIVYAISNRKEMDHWGWSLASGIINLLLGILLVARPDITIAILPFYVGFAILFRSVMGIGWAIEMKRQNAPDWGALLLLGILGLIFAFILLWNPVFAGMTIIFYTAFAFILAGFFHIFLSFRLRKLRNIRA